MRIVLTNDDGIDAPGIATLEALVREIRPDAQVVVIAPDGPRSGIGHAVSHSGSVVPIEACGPGRWAVTGTPADCTRLALARGGLLESDGVDAMPVAVDWVLAGINQGANLGVDVYHSGTAAAAREAGLLGTPAIAISQYTALHRELDWNATRLRTRAVLDALLHRPPAPGAFWNINLPHPADDRTDAEWVECGVDPSPLPIRFEAGAGGLRSITAYHDRARKPRLDVDVCLGGRIAVSEIHPA